MPTIQIKRGAKANIPTTGMSAGEPLFCTDTGELYIATGATTKVTAVPDLTSLSAIGTVATDDLLFMYDASASAGTVAARNITFAALKTALNIPAGSSDEKVAVVSGGTAGYIWGTDGTDGIIRVGNGLTATKDGANGFVTYSFAIASQAQGDIVYRGASSWDRLAAAAAAGYLLQSGGAAANPSWTNTIDGGTFT